MWVINDFTVLWSYKLPRIIARNLYQLNANEVPLTLYDTC